LNADMSTAADTRLLADVGGTNARFAWQAGPNAPLAHIQTLRCADFDSIEAAMRHYLDGAGRGTPRRCAMGIANPVFGDWVQMTNHHWGFSIAGVQAALGLEQFVVINDFTALALAIPLLKPHELRQVGGQAPVPGKAIGLLGAGTGLGMGGLVPCGNRWAPLEGEGGHIGLAPTNGLEADILAHLRSRFGRVSVERVLSGPGLSDLYEAMVAVRGEPRKVPTPSAAQIVEAALARVDPLCEAVLSTFCGWLGSVAGDLALMLGARGGIYIGGGIVPRLGHWLDLSDFRERFDDKGRLSAFVRPMPVYVIGAEVSPALLGVAQALD
jgi:glucokinase